MSRPLPTLLPLPHSVQTDDGDVLLCRDGQPCCRIETAAFDHAVYTHACSLLTNCCPHADGGAYPVRVTADPAYPLLQEHQTADAYAIRVTDQAAELIGYDAGGVLYAVQTFMQLVRREGGDISLPCCTIIDWPSFPTRGLFIEDRYGTDFLTRQDWFDAVDYFAQMKFNTLTIGVYGCWCQQFDGMVSEFLYIPFRKHPELKAPRHVKYYSVKERRLIWKENVLPVMFREDSFGDVIAYAKERNITVKPLFNSYGHNTLIPRMFPELSAKDEDGNPTGFGVCTADDRTYEIMFDLYDEIIDRYLAPNGIDAMQIGLDEVWEGIGMDMDDPFKFHTPFCRCERCRSRDRSELMIEYIIRLLKHLKQKGMRSVYIYQDMLQYEFNVLDETLAQRLRDADVYDIAVIDWWNYAHESRIFRGKPLNSCFRSIIKSFTGYYHWSTPMEYLSNIRGCARLAQQHGFEGMEAYSSYDHCHDRSYWYAAELAWNIDTLEKQEEFLRRYASFRFPGLEGAEETLALMADMTDNLRQDGQYSSALLYQLDYYTYSYVKADKPYPRQFPEEVFERLHDGQPAYEAAFRRFRAQAARAMLFFDRVCAGDASPMAKTWRSIALHYLTVADEYLGLLGLEKETDAQAAATKLKALLEAREALMLAAEETRIEANQLMYLREQSIYRQILCDLLAHAEACVQEGKPWQVKMTDLTGITGKALRALR